MGILLCLAIALSASAGRADEPADSQDAPREQTTDDQDGRTPAPERRVLIYRAKHMQADDLAESVGRLLQREQNADVVIIPESTGNQLLISGPRKTLSPVIEILEQIDRPPSQIQLEILCMHGGAEIGDDLSPKQVAALIRSHREDENHAVESLQLTTIGDHLVTVELGERKPTIVGSQFNKSGRTNTLQMEDTGTVIMLQAASPDRQNISIQFEYEASQIGTAEKSPVIAEPIDGDPIRAPSTSRRKLAMMIHLQDGETKIVRATRDATNRFVMTITASVVPEKHD